jgi:hypothetical protein
MNMDIDIDMDMDEDMDILYRCEYKQGHGQKHGHKNGHGTFKILVVGYHIRYRITLKNLLRGYVGIHLPPHLRYQKFRHRAQYSIVHHRYQTEMYITHRVLSPCA